MANDLKDDHPSSRPHDPSHLPQGQGNVDEVSDSEPDRRADKLIVVERERMSVPGNELDAVVGTPVAGLLDGQWKHGAGEVEAYHMGDLRLPQEIERKVSGAGSNVECRAG